MPKVILAELNLPFWLEVLSVLAESDGWRPVYWTATPDLERPIEKHFPGCVFHPTDDARRGRPAKATAGLAPAAVDEALLTDLAVYETIALKMMDRLAEPGAFDYGERVAFYHKLVGYWSAVLDRFEPEIALFPTAPHVVYDYVLYALCQRRGIETIMFERSPLPGRIFPVRRFEDGPEAIIARYQALLAGHDGRPVELSPELEEYLGRMSGSYRDGIPAHLKYKLKKERTPPPLSKRLRSAAWQVSSLLRRRPVRVDVKLKGRPIEEAWTTIPRRWRYQRSTRRLRERLAEHYQSLTSEVDLDRPFVFVALHCQPERSTSPLGGAFVHQELMVDLLSRCLPEGWRLYVKEHVSQFRSYQRADLGKSQAFYSYLASRPEVRLVPLSFSSFDLIDRARAVATVTSTAGWEAVLRGKPALIFGQAPYRGCEGVFYTPDEAALRAALEAIASGYTIDPNRVRLFLKAMEEACRPGYIDPIYAEVGGIDHQTNIDNLVAMLRTPTRPGKPPDTKSSKALI